MCRSRSSRRAQFSGLRLALIALCSLPLSGLTALTHHSVSYAKKSVSKPKSLTKVTKTKTRAKPNSRITVKKSKTRVTPAKSKSSKRKMTPIKKSRPARSRVRQTSIKRAPNKRTVTKKTKLKPVSPSRRTTATRKSINSPVSKSTNKVVRQPSRQSIGGNRSNASSANRTSVEQRRGIAGQSATPGSKTTTTTTTTTKRRKSKTVKRSQNKRVRRKKTVRERQVRERRAVRDDRYRDRRRGYDDRSYGGGGFGGGGYGGRPAPQRRFTCRPQGGRMMVNLGIGAQDLQDADNTKSAYTLGIGYRADMLGVMGEAQFASVDDESQFSNLRGQLRLYIPVGTCLDVYPTAGLSRFQEADEHTYAIDLGLGVDYNLGGQLSLGARYNRSFFTDEIKNINDDQVEESDTFMVQVGFYF